MLELHTEQYSDSAGITCVEKAFLLIAELKGKDYRKYFYESFIEFDEVFSDFLYNDYAYLNYLKIPRLQNVAVELGEVQMQSFQSDSISALKYLETNLIKQNPALAMVELQVDNEIFRPWRDDHFILLYAFDGQFIRYLNDYPLEVSKISKEEFEENYKNLLLIFDILKTEYKGYMSIVEEKIVGLKCTKDITTRDYTIESETVPRIRDACGLLKILRRRTCDWLKYLQEMYEYNLKDELFRLLQDEIHLLNKLYTYLEFQNLRKKYKNAETNEIIKNIKNHEKQWRMLLAKEV